MVEPNLILTINSHPFYQLLVNYLGENIVLLFLFTLGIFIYSIFIWHFDKKLAKRDLFKLNLDRYRFDNSKWVWFKKLISVILYLVEYCVLFPIYIFFWFGIITIFLFVIAKNIEVKNIMLISMSIVAAIRMASYYNENLANDIAKLIPFALLAILITDPYFFSVQRVFERILEIPNLLTSLLDFVIFVFVIEGLFRFLYLISLSFKREPAVYEDSEVEDVTVKEIIKERID